MDELDKRLLNRIQRDFPLVPEPFAELGTILGISADEVIPRVARLKSDKVIRQISGIFDTRSLGYRSSLVAMKVKPSRIERATTIINSHPGVSHNYQRNHEFNLWFTIAVPPASSLEATIARLHELTGADSTRVLPTLKLFKIGVDLDIAGERPVVARARPIYGEDRRPKLPRALTEVEIGVVRELQQDLPLEPRPFDPMATRIGIPLDELFARLRQLGEEGYLRRFAAILFHRQAGYKANGMAVWKVPADRADEVGAKMASFAAVSHCYHRPTYPDWPYSVFTMIHGRTKADCNAVIAAISEATGISEYTVLFSAKEFKKTRLLFYTPESAEWEAKYLKVAPADVG